MGTNNHNLIENKSSKPLQVIHHGADVFCQNPKTRKWDRSERIVECLPYRQYRIGIDGAVRITLRNHHHIRHIHQGILVIPNGKTVNSSSNTGTDLSYSLESSWPGSKISGSLLQFLGTLK